jgi:hypothetical protein
MPIWEVWHKMPVSTDFFRFSNMVWHKNAGYGTFITGSKPP